MNLCTVGSLAQSVARSSAFRAAKLERAPASYAVPMIRHAGGRPIARRSRRTAKKEGAFDVDSQDSVSMSVPIAREITESSRKQNGAAPTCTNAMERRRRLQSSFIQVTVSKSISCNDSGCACDACSTFCRTRFGPFPFPALVRFCVLRVKVFR